MIKIIWAIGLTIVCSTSCHLAAFAQLSENFNDNDFTKDPEWQGNASDFAVQSGVLRLQALPEKGQSYLAAPSQAMRDGVWEFSVRMEFNPSDANHARIYLASDQQDLTGPLEGYYVLVGGRTDEVSLYRQDLTGSVKIIDGVDGVTDVSTVNIRIRVTCDEGGNWELHDDPLMTGEFATEGRTSDPTYPASAYFGIFCKYTSSRADGFHFDDIMVAGEPGSDGRSEPPYKGVIITEIHADPSPVLGLPEVEFIEIHNRTAEPYTLGGWTLSDGSATGVLPSVALEPAEYLVLTSSSVEYGQFDSSVTVATPAGMPSLNNSGDAIVLRSRSGAIVDSVNYSDSWYKDTEKAGGGWTLELIDPENLCGEEDNWIAAQDPAGGTPGRRNSVFGSKPDHTGPRLTHAVALDPFLVRIHFNEKLTDEPVLPQDIVVEPPVRIAGVSFTDRSLRAVDVALDEALESRKLYSVAVKRVRDCSRNMIDESTSGVQFALPEEADSLDIVINEILFNPNSGGADFIELFNRSPKYINLKGCMVGDYSGGVPGNTKLISATDRLLTPGGYAVLASDPDAVMNHYPLVPAELMVGTSLPSLPNDAGSVAILNAAGKIIDALAYSSDWHSAFLSSDDGVSLERVSADVGSTEPENWNSASSASGYASPGRENSNTREEIKLHDNAIVIDPPVFRPVSGSPGFTLIRYKFDRGGYVANARVLDAQGRTIKVLTNNDLLGAGGFYTWEGDRDDGSRARVGYYWLWFEVFSSSGEVMTFRERIVIAGDF